MVSVNRRDIMMNVQGRKKHMTSAQIIIFGFMVVIFMGALLLMLPISTKGPGGAPFLDALFTSTSAVCVTGLIVHDTATYWTEFGQFVIISLIQVGGMGVVTVAVAVAMVSGKKIGLRERSTMQDAISAPKVGGIVRFTGFILKGTFIVELTGAVLMAPQFIKDFGFVKGIWYAVFHSISAFCNAGIDLFGETSLSVYVSNPLVNITTIGLIIVSGLGFIVWWDLWDKFRKVLRKELSPSRVFRVLRLQSKLVLTMTGILVFSGAFLVFIFESGNPSTLKGAPLGTKLMASFFQSVTTRTAGFYTMDQSLLSTPTVIISLLWMFIGGSPMGTAGGVKTTTIAVLILSIAAYLQGKKDVEVYGRRIRESYLRSAMVVAGTSVLILFTMTVLLSAVMPGVDLADVLYEITSAGATVGLSRGLTPQLNVAGKWIVILTMYLGRIGPLTLGTAVVMRVRNRPGSTTHLGEEDIMIG